MRRKLHVFYVSRYLLIANDIIFLKHVTNATYNDQTKLKKRKELVKYIADSKRGDKHILTYVVISIFVSEKNFA